MANEFSKEEVVYFDQLLEGFEDALVMSMAANVFRADETTLERANDTIWRPQPYIIRSFDGLDQTANFNNQTQLSVPTSVSSFKSVPFIMDSLEMRDMLQEGRLKDSASQRLASDINVSLLNTASTLGSVVVTRSNAPGSYDDIAACDAVFNEQGIPVNDRWMFLSSRSYNGLAGNLADRQTMGPKVSKAYERSYVGMNAGFETMKMDYANRILAQTATPTISGAGQTYVPLATQPTTGGGTENVDNRFQQLTVSDTTGVVAGDAFTIDGVNAVHHIANDDATGTKRDTGQLKTFRVVSVDSGTTMTITPPIIAVDNAPVESQYQYQNVTATPADAAAITFINTAAADINPFWHQDAIELVAGSIAVPENAGAQVMRATTDQGIQVTFQKQFDINTSSTKYRLDTYYGTVCTNPEMAGILLFSQP